MSKRLINNIILVSLLTGFAIAFRIAPHPANFAPIGAIAIIGGALMPRRYAVWLPVAAMAISDLVIGTHNLIFWTWGSFALIALLSSIFLYKKQLDGKQILAAGVSSGIIFFVLTNFGVWLQSGMYTHSWTGLTQCYINALPFLRNTLLGDVFFTATIYSAYLAFNGAKIQLSSMQRTR